MLNFISSVFIQFNEYAKLNPVMAGAFSLWALGVTSFLCRGVPKAIWEFITKQTTTTLYFDSSGYNYNVENFASFLLWFENHKWSKWSRSLSMESSGYHFKKQPMTVGIGYGQHMFFYKGRLFRITHSTESKAGSDKVIHNITITMLGRNKQIVYGLIEEFRYKRDEDKVGIYKFITGDREWVRAGNINNRDLSTVIIDREIKAKILSIIIDFKKNKTWYDNRGLAYKKTFLLHGIPGTGKTSIIKALACYFKMDIYLININGVSDETLLAALSTAPDDVFVVMEDFDSADVTKQRVVGKDKIADIVLSESSLSLTGILNALDGIVPLDNKLIFMTTNVLESIDTALTRKGRVDYVFELKALRHKEVLEYIELMFPYDAAPNDVTFEDILGCDIQSLYFEHKDDFDGFIDAIPQRRLTLCEKHG